jgi:hypothetical protein
MKRIMMVVMMVWASVLQASDTGDTRASDFFRTLILAGGFEQTTVIQKASYGENKISVLCQHTEEAMSTIEHSAPSGSSCYFERLCLFCNEKLTMTQTVPFKELLRWGPKDRGEDYFRKQDSLLKKLCDKWSLYNSSSPS